MCVCSRGKEPVSFLKTKYIHTKIFILQIILEAILPCYVKQIQLPTYNREGKTEKEIIQQLAIAIKTLVNNCEGLSK